ncbi:MAG: hypothetical protein IKQ44_06555 [Lachnospiraceae bacterium]|nr:hypothetical protein [Lachnospiraceae bacterium]
MAYDVHMFRGRNWWEGTDNPITEEEILAVNGVKRISEVSDVNPQNGVAVRVGGNDMFSFDKAIIILRKGILDVSISNEEAIEILRPIADALGAVIQGDEGEYY